MSKMWRGPSPELKKAYSDPLFGSIAWRCSQNGVFFVVKSDGRSARVYTLTGDNGTRSLDTVFGYDPFDTALEVARIFTPYDAEFLAQWLQHIERQVVELIALVRAEQALCVEIDLLADELIMSRLNRYED